VRSRGLLFSLCDPQQVEENKSRRAWKLRRLVLAPRGLTGLLNPLSIWHKIISVAFHELFQLYFIPSQGCYGTYIVEFRTAAGEAVAISIPTTEAAAIRHFQERMPYGLLVPDVDVV